MTVITIPTVLLWTEDMLHWIGKSDEAGCSGLDILRTVGGLKSNLIYEYFRSLLDKFSEQRWRDDQRGGPYIGYLP